MESHRDDREVFYLLVEEGGEALLLSVDIVVCSERVEDVQEAVRTENKCALKHILASHLVVFANRAKWSAKEPLSKLSDLVTGFGLDEDDPLIVQRPRVVPELQHLYPSCVPRVTWTVAVEPCVQIQVRAEDQLIRLPSSLVDGTGLGHRDRQPDQPLILYRRFKLVNQWDKMQRCSIQTFAITWIVGPPGCGKPCAAFSFACSLDRTKWDVLWIHFNHKEEQFYCVWLQGTKKSTCIIHQRAIDPDLRGIMVATLTSERRTIVFLDGFDASKPTEEAHLIFKRWHQYDRVKHRLVCVTSMVILGNQFSPDKVAPTPTNADSDLQRSDYEVHSQMDFTVISWCFGDFMTAVSNDEFFETVRSKFPAYPSQPTRIHERMMRLKALEEKFSVVGGSPRLMFDFTTAKAIRVLDKALADVFDQSIYPVGWSNLSSSIHTLIEWTESVQHHLVSDYVMRQIAAAWGLKWGEKRIPWIYPYMHRLPLETWFLAKLRATGLSLIMLVESKPHQGQWEQSEIFFFDSDNPAVSISSNGPTWLAPCKHIRGGYDAVFVDEDAQLVRFVCARQDEHPIDYEPFVDCLNGLPAHVDTLELCFVVPATGRSEFECPVSTSDLIKNVIEARSLQKRSLDICIVGVRAVGIEYNPKDSSPDY